MRSIPIIKKGEWVIYIIFWIIVMSMPIYLSQSNDGIEWDKVQQEWLKFSPYLLIFVVHNYFLFPKLFVERKRLLYFAATIIFIFLVGYLGELLLDWFGLKPGRNLPTPPMKDMPPMNSRPPMEDMPPMDDMPPMRKAHSQPKSQNPWHEAFMNNMIVSILVVGFNAAIKLTIIWQAGEQRNKELEQEKLKTELAFLKNQISPHFFMNTLNNIHALIDIKAEDAKTSVIKLSKMMRYLLYDSDEGKTTLAKEIEFINSYVDLMKLRFTEQVKIKLSFPENIPNIEIPPMLFTSLLENAFKHGISYQKESFVEVIMNTDDEYLYFRINNSKKDSDNGLNEPGGIGLENLRKRLDLIYRDQYILEQKEDENTFDINIKLPING